MKNMTTSIMGTLLLTSLLAFLAIAAQARTLSDWQNKISMIIDYGRPSRSPPPSPSRTPPPRTKLITSVLPCDSVSSQPTNHLMNICNYEKKTTPSPPPPKVSPSPHQLKTGRYERDMPSPPPPPSPSSSPDHLAQLGPPCVIGSPCSRVITMVTDYVKPRPGGPPTPKASPPQHHASVEQLLRRTSSQNYYAASS